MARARAELINEADMVIEHIINTPVKDRYHSVVLPMGARVDNFLKNSVVLWLHNSSPTNGMPIGKCVALEVSEKGITAKTKFNASDDFAVKAFNAYKDGFMNAWSIGFRPTKVEFVSLENREFINQKYNLSFTEKDVTDAEMASWSGLTVIPEWDLLEYSAVPVPGNQDAVTDELRSVFQSRGLELIDNLTMAKFGLNREVSRTLYVDKDEVDMDKIEKGIPEVAATIAAEIIEHADDVAAATEKVSEAVAAVAEVAAEIITEVVEDLTGDDKKKKDAEAEAAKIEDTVAAKPAEVVAPAVEAQAAPAAVPAVDPAVTELNAKLSAVADQVKTLTDNMQKFSELVTKGFDEEKAQRTALAASVTEIKDAIPSDNIASIRKVTGTKSTPKAQSSWTQQLFS